jgi:aspartyl-tRNA(Asn)/glutamyl-tRNA(Gln) amidotransferase subunit A
MNQAGTVALGKVNLDEFCMGSATTPVYTGAVRNPWNPLCSAGGSSGGSAAAVAAGCALAALGTDTGGSVRQPAAFCGVVGIKPTHGLCSRWGVVAFASSLDCPGPLTRTVADGALVLQAMAGHDSKDSTSLNCPIPTYKNFLGASIQGKKVGVPKEWYEQAQLDPDIRQAWEKAIQIYQEAGCQIVMVDMPYSVHALPCYYILACAEAASNLQRYDGVKYGFRASHQGMLEELYNHTRGQGFGPEVKRRILTGTFVLSHGYYDSYYGQATRIRRMIEQELASLLQQVDVILTPTTPTPAFALDPLPSDPLTMYWNDILTVPVNIGNGCGMSVPCGLSSQGLPLGMQLIGPALGEDRLFSFGYVLEQAMPPLGTARGLAPLAWHQVSLDPAHACHATPDPSGGGASAFCPPRSPSLADQEWALFSQSHHA